MLRKRQPKSEIAWLKLTPSIKKKYAYETVQENEWKVIEKLTAGTNKAEDKLAHAVASLHITTSSVCVYVVAMVLAELMGGMVQGAATPVMALFSAVLLPVLRATHLVQEVQKVDGEEPKCEEKEVILQHHAVEANVIVRNDKDLQKPSNPKEISQVIPTVAAVRAAFVKARTVSECVDVPYDDTSSDNRRGPTGSWPRGILKRRPRSLSESHVGCMGSVGSFGSYSSSFDLEGLEDEVLEKEEEEEEGNESSSPGSKKTVRFSEVVSKQLFRSNSSILGQRAKNQRKALKKRRAQERKLSESDQEITGSKKSDDEDDDEDEGVGAEEEIVQEMKEIDLEGDIFDSTTCEEETTDTDNNNTQSDNNSKNNITNKELAPNKKKNKKKGKKNKNKIKSLELSNAMIFELDIEQ